MLSELIEKLSSWRNSAPSGDQAKQRLRLVLAHDRSGISNEMLELMRQEILEVVSRYIEIDPDETELSIESDQRMTALIANLPIRRIKRYPTQKMREN